MNEFSYSGIPTEYQPNIGTNRSRRPIERARTSIDYYDLDALKEMLALLIAESADIKDRATGVLNDFNLEVQPQTRLHEAQTQVAYQAETPPDHVSFQEYNILSPQKHRAAQYVRSEYEHTMRGPIGTNAMDVYLIASIINNEARNIDRFLTQYLGDVNDSSEYRTIELFQDWAKPSFQHTGALRYFLQERDKARNALSESELAQIDSETSKQYQAIFQAKLNVINTQYRTAFDAFANEYTYLSDVFYNKVLGPAVYFRTRVMKQVEPTVASEIKKTVLGKEVVAAQAALNANMAGNITDHLRRNNIYQERITRLFQLLQSRSAYRVYIGQLSTKGLTLPNVFRSSSEVAPVPDGYFAPPEDDSNVYRSPHNKLDGITDEDAHPQYLLRDRGSILGDVWVKEGVKIAGVDIPNHSHKGIDIDGTPQITGTDIEEGSLYSELVDSTHRGAEPAALSVSEQGIRSKQGVVQVDATLAWKQTPGERFELQIVPADSRIAPPLGSFISIDHSHFFDHFSTEDSNFLSHEDLIDEKIVTTDANYEKATYDTPLTTNLPFQTYPIMAYNNGVKCLEVGTDLYFISPNEGIVKTALMSSAEEVIHSTPVEIYGSERLATMPMNLCYDSMNKKLYWFDLKYRLRDEVLVDHYILLRCYDPALGTVSTINTYPTYTAGSVNNKYLFVPSISAIYYQGFIYASCVEMSIDEETGALIFPVSYESSLRKFDVTNGEMIVTDLDPEVFATSFTYYDGKVMFLCQDAGFLEFESGADVPIDRYRRMYEMVDTESVITVVPHNLDGIPNDDYGILAITADIYNNIYVNVSVPTGEQVDGNLYRIIKVEVDDE